MIEPECNTRRNREPQLFPTRKEEPIVSDWVDEKEQLHWLTFVIGFIIGCVATLGLVLL